MRGRRSFDDLRHQLDEELAQRPDGEQIREQVQRELEAELATYANAQEAERSAP
jgi:predicted component of type VI protein secretion system